MVRAFLPTLVRVRQGLVDRHGPLGEQMFRTNVLIGFMHELEHAGNNPVPMVATKEAKIETERVAWAGTCEYTTRPLIETYRMPLPEDMSACYGTWVQSGRNAHSQLWVSTVERVHSMIYNHLAPASQAQPLVVEGVTAPQRSVFAFSNTPITLG